MSDQFATYLADNGRLQPAMLERAQRVSESTGESLSVLLLKLGLMSERDLANALAQCYGSNLVESADYPIDPVDGADFKIRFLRHARLVPLALSDEELVLAMADPGDRFAIDSMALLTGRSVRVMVGLPSEIEQAIERLYGPQRETASNTDDGLDGFDDGLETDIERLRDQASEAPVVRLVNRMIGDAIDLRASDIHLEPYETRLRLRYRVDGVLQDGEAPPARLKAAIVSRLKIMAKLNIAERRLPQDGRIKLAVRGSAIDLRVSTLPSLFGEGVVLRVLNRDSVSLDFASLGIEGDNLQRLKEGLARPNGIFLVTGPTGSGKTTTLYAALSSLNDAERKIVTVEDPVEYQLDGVNQIQVKPTIGLTFASALRAILRQDPDIVLIGEIRDLETAQIASQAALTGHLVLSTLHTNSAAASVTRLLDMGVESYLVTATLNGVAAQRLVRRLCDACKTPYSVDEETSLKLGLDRLGGGVGDTLYHPKGCEQCGQSGYRGRTSILETLVMTDDLRRIILKDGDERAVHRAAVAAGMRTLYEDGLRKALLGETSVEEVLRTAQEG
ncbi:type II secretion system protein GspE [Iodidimonas gelatinilytica]|uniref:Type II secretion system protein E n=2 Tax=Iodidimonas gelatinilytica TaxID=1236966 RepID=A0A5A7MVX0_9PROT|nr:type II secretion system protein GspE [Iodidimonas gelatinilytica]